ncbi:MAG: hypothetical protein Q9197_001556 [Variospora fuerteventurae]
MSFLNSVLSSIGGDGQQAVSQSAQSHPRPELQLIAQKADTKSKIVASQSDVIAQGHKRKAEESFSMPKSKAIKDEQGQRHTEVNSAASGPIDSASKEAIRPKIFTSKSALAVPYRGTSRPSPTSASPDTPTTDSSRAVPKKGSYAEIMARASANNKPSVGVIRHKPKEAVSAKKEILMRKKGMLPKGMGGIKDGRSGASVKDRHSLPPSAANPKSPPLPGKKPPQLSYKGTAAPKPQPAYKGTMKPKPSIADTARRKDLKMGRSRSSSINPPRRGRDPESVNEDEEDELDEQEEPYSDESDDMEAGFSDVEEEETAATRAAKEEDKEELRRENQLKKEKEERKRKLAAMAAKAPKPKY